MSVSADNGSVAAGRIDGSVTINNNYPPAPASVWRPVRVGMVPALASAFQPRHGLRELVDRARERNGTVGLTQVLSGGGGVGKSQLAASYAQQAHAEGVDVLVWVDAAETSRIVAAYAEAAGKVKALGAAGVDAEGDAARFLEWLTVTDRSWLVVLDDLTDVEGAGPWWPRPPAAGGSGRVLATTRRRGALLSGAGRALVDVGLYSKGEALDYLRDRLGAADAVHLLDRDAGDLTEALGLLPLALSHAAAYVINEAVTSTDYLRLFTDRDSRLDVLLPTGADTDAYGRQVTTSLLLALDAAQRREPVGLAVPAVRFAARLDPAGHPLQLWTTAAVTDYLTAQRTPHPDAPALGPVTPDQARAALRLLHHYALLTSDSRDGHRAVRMHALTARAARETAPDADAPTTYQAVANALAEIWPRHTHTTPDLTAVLHANTDVLAAGAGAVLQQPDGELAVLREAGRTLIDAGLYAAAVTYWLRLAADTERLLGGQHPATLTARGNLAASYTQAGRTREAIVLQERVLADREGLLGDRHLHTVTARGDLALAYAQAGRTAEAIALQERVLADREGLLGDGHLDTLTARGDLAACYWEAGRTAEAIVLQERVLADRERLLGDQHPHTLTARGDLALSYWQAGRTGEATDLIEPVLADRERLLGDQHPHTLTARRILAACLWQTGRRSEAVDLMERVFADRERALGALHPDTLAALKTLSFAYWQTGNYSKAVDTQEWLNARGAGTA
ncbi:tetratricopeptide repeat protein [Kitasatospora sp. NPDC049285]|uniref:tetratricopeptide repeat protein n=1 Tax=Kitasatospora sp. NPDC049285 TaxID=3157096 RepID=UPI003427E290